MNEIAQVISTIGFPIFSFLLAGYSLKYVYDKERSSLDTAINKISDLTSAVNHNSETISRLIDKMEGNNNDEDRKE